MEGTGGFYETNIDPVTNSVSIKHTGKKGTMTPEQKSYYLTLKAAIDSLICTTFTIVDKDPNIKIADGSGNIIDVGDIDDIGNHQVLTKASIMGHA